MLLLPQIKVFWPNTVFCASFVDFLRLVSAQYVTCHVTCHVLKFYVDQIHKEQSVNQSERSERCPVHYL